MVLGESVFSCLLNFYLDSRRKMVISVATACTMIRKVAKKNKKLYKIKNLNFTLIKIDMMVS